MSAIWSKVWYDLWQQRGRTLLAILSIAVGVFAIGTIFGLVDQLLAGMDDAHRAVAPSHINVILRGYVDQEVVDGVAELTGVAGVDPANQVSVRYQAGDGEWRLGNVVMRPDYEQQTYDQVVLKEGEWPEAAAAGETGGMGIERLSSQYFDVALGDDVLFDVGGETLSFAVNGLIRHPFVQPPPFGGQAHFFADAGTLAEFGVPEGQYGQLLVRVEPYGEEKAREVAAEIRSYLSQQGVGVAVNIYQDPEVHWGRSLVEGVTLVLQVMAAVSLFLSVVLVLTTTTALITQQTDQIGVLKAVGARRVTIAQIYLAGVLVYGVIALLIALPLGALTAFVASRWFLNLFNIDYNVFQLSTRGVLLQVGAALVAPLLAALWPIVKGTSLSVREALATYGLGGDFGSGWVDRLVEAVTARFLPTLYATALTNMVRRKERLALTVLVLSTAGVMFLVVMTLISSTSLTLYNEMARRGYDLRIGFSGDQARGEIERLVQGESGVVHSDFLLSKNATMLRAGEQLEDSAGLGTQLVGLPIASPVLQPVIISGRWLEPGDERALVISQETAVANDIAAGDTVVLDLGLYGVGEWTVIGTYNVIYEGGFATEALYAPLTSVQAATGNGEAITQLFVQVDETAGRSADAVASALRSRFEAEGIGVDLYTTAVKADERAYLDNQFNSVVSMLLGLAMLMATVGGIGLMGSLSISVLERRREIGVLRAIGATSRRVMSLFILEGVLQALLSWSLAVPLAFLLSQPLARLLGQTMMDLDLDFLFNLPAVAIWLLTVVVIAVLASMGPARQATRISVRHSLAYE